MSKNHLKCGDNIGYGRFKLRLPVLRLGFWLWAFHSRSVMTRAFIWHKKVKFANLQLPNVMLKDHNSHQTFVDYTTVNFSDQAIDNSSKGVLAPKPPTLVITPPGAQQVWV